MSATKIAHIYNPDNQSQEELIANFVVRHAEFAEIFKDIKSSQMQGPEQHYIIQGPRGTGKTTLLLRLYYEVKNDASLNAWLIPIIFSEEQYHINTLCKLWESVADFLEDSEEFKGLYDELERSRDAADYDDTCFGLLSKALREKKKKIVLFLDNLGDMLDRFTEQEHHRLREILLTSPDLRIIGASSVTLETTYDYTKPFFDFFRFVYMGGLDSEETRRLLLSLGKNYNVKEVEDIVNNQPERVEIMRRLTGGIPRTIILLFEVFIDESGNSFKDLEIVLDRVTPLYKHRMEDLSRQQQAIIDAMALNWDAMSVKEIVGQLRMESKAVSAQLKQLEKNRLVHKIATTTKNYLYQISERFFNIWYLMRQGRRRERNKVIWLVKFMQEWCSREELEDRAKKHIEALARAEYNSRHAYFMTEALAKLLSGDLQHELISKTRHFLSTRDKGLMKDLSKSDRELYEEAGKAFKSKDYRGCITLLKKIQDQDSSSTAYAYGLVYYNLRELDEAANYYLKAIDKGDVNALNNLAEIYFDQNRYDEAESYYLKAIEKDDVYASNNLANLYYNQKRYDEAEKYYLKAIEKNDVSALYNLAILYQDQNRYDEAESYYLKAIEKGHVSALYNLAILYQDQNRYDEAESYYLKAIEKGHVYALNNLAILYQDQKRYDEAESYYLKAIEKGHLNALNNLANLYQDQKRYDEAEEYYLKAVEEGNAYAAANLSIMFFKRKKEKKKALELIEKAAVQTDDLLSKYHLIRILLWNNKTEEAMKNFEKIMTDKEYLEQNDQLINSILLMFTAKKQYHFVLRFFEKRELSLKDRFRPTYYALMHFMKDEYPNEYKKMGEEIRETVEEVINEINRLRVDYR